MHKCAPIGCGAHVPLHLMIAFLRIIGSGVKEVGLVDPWSKMDDGRTTPIPDCDILARCKGTLARNVHQLPGPNSEFVNLCHIPIGDAVDRVGGALTMVTYSSGQEGHRSARPDDGPSLNEEAIFAKWDGPLCTGS